MSKKEVYAQSIKTEAKRLGFLSCGISKAEFLEEEAPRLESWLHQNKHGKMYYMENHFDKRLNPTLLASFNPNVNKKDDPRKVIRGGSWKDVAYFLQVSTRDYEHADSARSFIGFRTVQDYLGTDATANAATN
jgi:hypothetical protein